MCDIGEVRRDRGIPSVACAQGVIAGSRAFAHLTRFARVVLVNGAPGLVVAPSGRLLTVVMFKMENERIVEMEVVNEPERQRELDLVVLEAGP